MSESKIDPKVVECAKEVLADVRLRTGPARKWFMSITRVQRGHTIRIVTPDHFEFSCSLGVEWPCEDIRTVVMTELNRWLETHSATTGWPVEAAVSRTRAHASMD